MELEPGEQLIFEGHPSWRSTLGFYIKGLVFVVVAGVIAYVAFDTTITAVAAIAVLAVVLVVGYLKRLSTTYTITDHRLHIRRGIIARAEQQTLVTRVQNVNTRQSVLQRMLAVGNVDFDTAAGDDYEFQFAGVASPHDVVDAVHRAQRAADSSPTAPR